MDVKPAAAATFPVLTRAKLADVTHPEWLIRDLVITDGLCCLYGLFGSYKSFIALDWGLCLATGTDWCDRTVKQCDVLYIAGEGVGGLKLRVAAWKQHHGITDPIPGFRIVPLAVNLMDKAEAERLILTVVEEQKADGFDPKLVVVDTLHRSMPGGDENSARGYGHRHQQCRADPTAPGVRHATRSSLRQGRRTGVARLQRPPRRRRHDHSGQSNRQSRVTLRVEKQKDIEDGQETHLQAQVVNLPLIAGSLKPRAALSWCRTTSARTRTRVSPRRNEPPTASSPT